MLMGEVPTASTPPLQTFSHSCPILKACLVTSELLYHADRNEAANQVTVKEKSPLFSSTPMGMSTSAPMFQQCQMTLT